MYKASEIARFVWTYLCASLPDFTAQYKRRDILRMRGLVVQMVSVGVGRGGWVRVHPTFSVLGPDIYIKDLDRHKCKDDSLDRDALFSQVGLEGISASAARRWIFPPETLLDETFAAEILTRLKQDSPISFTAARKDLARAFKLFIKHSRYSTDKPPFDFEIALHARFQELEARLDRPDCIALCRADSEKHAKLLKLPPIVWPLEWPKSVPPWPKDPSFDWARRLLG